MSFLLEGSNDASSSGGPSPQTSGSTLPRRRQRACDACRRKKARCNGDGLRGSRCTTCITFGLECTFDGPSQRRPRAKKTPTTVEARLESLESTLRKIQNNPPVLPSSAKIATLPKPLGIGGSLPEPINDTAAYAENDGPEESLSKWLERLEIDPTYRRPFVGSGHNKQIIKNTIEYKRELYGDSAHSLIRRPHFWNVDQRGAQLFAKSMTASSKRDYTFPDSDLIPILIDCYFSHYNNYFPLLHRPLFEKAVADGVHLQNHTFGAVLLLVCAIGARYSQDPRVLAPGDSEPTQFPGWHWFEQIGINSWPVLAIPRLYDVQVYALSVMYLVSSSITGTWLLISHGLKLAMDAGVHRKIVYGENLCAEEELWRRAFWVLLCFDRLISPGVGRPLSVQEEDFDVDWPVDCDDEYWDTDSSPNTFCQPNDTPSRISYFIHFLKFQQIYAYALRSLHGVKVCQLPFGSSRVPTEQEMIIDVDSALNQCAESTPAHLIWDPQRHDNIFFHQAGVLRSMYYHIQIIVHRPYVARKDVAPSLPSLAICTNAARANSRVLETVSTRTIDAPYPWIASTAFASAVVLLLNLWNPQTASLLHHTAPELEDIKRCLRFLTMAESKMFIAGRSADIVRELASFGKLPLDPELGAGVTDQLSILEAAEPERSVYNSASGLPDYDPHFAPAERTASITPSVSQASRQTFIDAVVTPSNHLESNKIVPTVLEPAASTLSNYTSALNSILGDTFETSYGLPDHYPMLHNSHSHFTSATQPIPTGIWANSPAGLGTREWEHYLGGIMSGWVPHDANTS